VSWIGAAHPESSVEVWCQDEARLGLIPIVRRVWSPVGERPVAVVGRKHDTDLYQTGSVSEPVTTRHNLTHMVASQAGTSKVSG